MQGDAGMRKTQLGQGQLMGSAWGKLRDVKRPAHEDFIADRRVSKLRPNRVTVAPQSS